MADTTRYLLYARKSTDEKERQVRSIEEQLNEMRNLARRSGLTVVAEVIEKKSAKAPGRPEFNHMLERIEAGEANGILAWHADRLARNSIDGGRLIYLLDTAKISRLQFFNSYVENTPQGKMMLNAEFGFSKYYVDSLSENVKRGHRNKVGRGECPCIAPLGYFNDHRTKRIVVDRDRAPIIRRAFEIYAGGDATLDTIRQYLGDNGVRTRTTKRSPGGKLVGRTLVSEMLSNPIYYGHFKWGGEVHAGTHEAIITKALYDEVQTVMNRRWRWSPSVHVATPKPYLGLLQCAECGGAISAEIQKGHTYYRCTKKNKAQRCGQPYVREEALDAEISGLLSPFQMPQGWGDRMRDQLECERTQAAHESSSLIARKRTEIDRLNARLLRLKELLLDGLVDADEARTDRARMMSDRKTVEEQIDSLSRRDNGWLEPFKEWLNDAESVRKIAAEGTLSDRRTLAKKIFGSNLFLDQRKARGKAVKPWAFLADNSLSHDYAHVLDLARTHFRENPGCGQ